MLFARATGGTNIAYRQHFIIHTHFKTLAFSFITNSLHPNLNIDRISTKYSRHLGEGGDV